MVTLRAASHRVTFAHVSGSRRSHALTACAATTMNGSRSRPTASMMRAKSVCVAPKSVRSSVAVILFTPTGSLNGHPVALHVDSLQLPHGKAPHVDVELVQAGKVTITRELNLQLQVVASYGLLAHREWSPDAWPAPCAIRPTCRELSGSDCRSGFGSEDCFVRHLRYPNRTHEPTLAVQVSGDHQARCQRRGRVLRQPEEPVEGGTTFTPL